MSIAKPPWPVNRLVVGAAVMLLTAGVPHRAWAHPEFNPLRNNRYLKIDLVARDRVRLAYTVMFGDAPAHAIRRAADATHDGQLDDAESAELGRRVAAEVKRGFKATVDGRGLEVAFETPSVGLAGAAVAPSPLSVDLVAFVDLDSRFEHVLTVDDESVLEQLGESEVRIEESPAVTILEARRGQASRDGKPQLQFVFRGPKFSALEDRTVTVRWSGRGVAARIGAAELIVVGGFLLVVCGGIGAALFVWRRRGQRSANG